MTGMENELLTYSELIRNMKTEPAQDCSGGHFHAFRAVYYDRDQTHFWFVFRCQHCDDLVQKTHERDKDEKRPVH